MVLITSLDRVNDRKLEERSYLQFEFYEGGNSVPVIRILPFYQNPEIEESKKANYIKYQPISRNSSLMSFTGSESRILNLSFRMTLPNIQEYSDLLFETKISKYESKEQLKEKFFKPGTTDPIKFVADKGNSADFDRHFSDLKGDLFDVGDFNSTNSGSEDLFGVPLHDILKEEADEILQTQRNKAIDIILYWVNLIRSSTLNNSKNPTLGPPIVRLNHGILYQDIPCVCTDYRIGFDESAGHDLKTLLPRSLRISMTLQELRLGNFGEYNVRKVIDRDNIVGWESIIGGSNTIDPVRTDIGLRYVKR